MHYLVRPHQVPIRNGYNTDIARSLKLRKIETPNHETYKTPSSHRIMHSLQSHKTSCCKQLLKKPAANFEKYQFIANYKDNRN